jgi:hypothetical protein
MVSLRKIKTGNIYLKIECGGGMYLKGSCKSLPCLQAGVVESLFENIYGTNIFITGDDRF